jgi:hypothetical protein
MSDDSVVPSDLILSHGRILKLNPDRTSLTPYSPSSDGSVIQLVTNLTIAVALTDNHQAFRLTRRGWILISNELCSITVLYNIIYGVTQDGFLAEYTKSGFEILHSFEDIVSCCSDHCNTVFVLTRKGQVKGFDRDNRQCSVPGNYREIISWSSYSGVIYLSDHRNLLHVRTASQGNKLRPILANKELVAQDYTYHLVNGKVIYQIDGRDEWQALDIDDDVVDIAVVGSDICLIGQDHYLIKDAFGDVSFRFHPNNHKDYPPLEPLKLQVA